MRHKVPTNAKGAASIHRMPFGAQLLPDGAVRFRLWAPACETVSVEIAGRATPLPMEWADGGWHELETDAAGARSRYRYVLPDGLRVPDPASRFQPDDIHGASQVIDPAEYRWRVPSSRGRPWSEHVIYELHVGAFTPQGTFRGVQERLDHLVDLGVTAIEIMPIADFPGRRNWGYDGALLYAPDSAYGRPEDLKALVDAAHERGLSMLLDVVYNHFGPDGNYLGAYAPEFFTERHQTPWGAAVNYDGDGSEVVREFVVHNALYWLEEFRFDGLRLDAVHAIIDDSDRPVLEALAERVRSSFPDRHIHLVLENEHNSARLLSRCDSKPVWYTAQWNDDVHHALHTAATNEGTGYYEEYLGDTAKLGRALAEGFAFQGETMRYSGRARGEPSAALPPAAFVAFIQNHDQIGNRACGERIGRLAGEERLRAIAAIYLLLPQAPLLFMGEEWNASSPFPFFCDFSGDLGEAVRKGRREEFAAFREFQDPEKRKSIPDPQADATFLSAKLDWNELMRAPHAQWLAWYRRILQARAKEIVPLIGTIERGGRYEILGELAVRVRWPIERGELVLDANLSMGEVAVEALVGARTIWTEGRVEAACLGAFSARWGFVER